MVELARRRLVFGLLAGLSPFALSFPAHAQQPPLAAKEFLERIYKTYVGDSAKGANGIKLDSTAAMRRYFSPDLAAMILADNAKAAKRGDVPMLDGDPFVSHQDWDIANLAVEASEDGAGKATGTVTFTESDKPERVLLDLVRIGRDWHIADITSSDGSLRALYRRK
jgi:Protein of unknown function (DUF3828)